MTYAVGDIHGYYDKYKELLERIYFSDDDTLYVLGDILDRGPESLRVLEDMAGRYNVIPIIGDEAVSGALEDESEEKQEEE